MTLSTTITNSPDDILKYQNDHVRTNKCFPLGRVKMISIGPNIKCPINPDDPIMAKWGRLMQLRDRPLPISQSLDRSMILVNAPLLDADGRVALPDVPDPTWVRAPLTDEELYGKEMVHKETNKPYRVTVKRDPALDRPGMCEQGLRARAEGFLFGTRFYAFSPVLSIAFQPYEDLGTFWAVDCRYNEADRTHATLLIEAQTGEVHFFGGLYDIVRASGEN